jgi:hypothetical protein
MTNFLSGQGLQKIALGRGARVFNCRRNLVKPSFLSPQAYSFVLFDSFVSRKSNKKGDVSEWSNMIGLDQNRNFEKRLMSLFSFRLRSLSYLELFVDLW